MWRGLNNPDVHSQSCLFPLSLSLSCSAARFVCLTMLSGLEHKVLRECAVCFGRWRDLQKEGKCQQAAVKRKRPFVLQFFGVFLSVFLHWFVEVSVDA